VSAILADPSPLRKRVEFGLPPGPAAALLAAGWRGMLAAGWRGMPCMPAIGLNPAKYWS